MCKILKFIPLLDVPADVDSEAPNSLSEGLNSEGWSDTAAARKAREEADRRLRNDSVVRWAKPKGKK